jgi:hypothetical protein
MSMLSSVICITVEGFSRPGQIVCPYEIESVEQWINFEKFWGAREAEGKDKPACDEESFLQPRRELRCKNLRKPTSSISFTILVLYIPRFLASSSHMLSCPGSLSLLRVEASSISHSSAVSTETCKNKNVHGIQYILLGSVGVLLCIHKTLKKRNDENRVHLT